MKNLLFYLLCSALLLGCLWLVKLVITGISPDFGYGFVSGMALIVLLIYSAERLGYKEPRY